MDTIKLQSVLGDYSVRPVSSSQRAESGRSTQKIYWFVIRGSDRKYRVRALTDNSLPSGISKELGIDEFMSNFDPEPEHYIEHTIPAIRSTLTSAVSYEEKRKIIARLGIDLEEDASVDEFIERLLIDSRFVCYEQSKEINEYIILLRKEGKLDEAVDFCEQALALSPFDENLLFNVARVYYEKSDYDQALKYLDRALQVNPDMEAARKFRNHLDKKTEVVRAESG